MILKFPAAFYEWAAEYPQVWWAASARWAMGRVAPGAPAEIVDEEGEPTGTLVMSHTDIDVWDQAIMAVCVAGWRYVLALGPEGLPLVAMQASKDEAALRAMLARVHAGELTQAEADELVKVEIRRQAEALRVDISFVDKVSTDENMGGVVRDVPTP